MRIKTLSLYLKKLKEIKYFFKNNSFRLKPGKYIVGFNYRFLCHQSYIKNCPFPNNRINSFTSTIVKIVNFFGYYRCRSNKSHGNYSAIYFANNNFVEKEIKIFNFDIKKILVLCTTKEEKEKQISFYENNKDRLCLPKCVDGGGKSIITDYIEKIELKDFINPIYAIIESTIKWCDYSEVRSINSLQSNIISPKALLKLKSSNVEFPFCDQHGDLSSDNLIYGKIDDKTGFWWIDWEHFGKRIFFYDLFFYIMNQAISFKNIGFTNNYLSGVYDEHLCKLFNSFGLKYNTSRKKEYFLYFFILFENERLNTISSNKIIEMYRKYVYNFENN